MGYASVVFEDKIYIISGGNESGPDYNPTKLVQIFDPATNQWTNGTSVPTGIISARACATTGMFAPKRIYVIGGATTSYARWETYNVINLTQIYDPETDTWTTGAPMLTPREDFGLAVVNDEIYAIGGVKEEKYLAVNEKYTPADFIPEFPSWTILPLVLTATTVVAIYRKRLSKTAQAY
jgi:N-acetylneuraminic acid mutarotase